MVLALAGDSTMTKDVPPAGGGPSSSVTSAMLDARDRALVLVDLRAAVLLADFVADLAALLPAVFVAVFVAVFFVDFTAVAALTDAALFATFFAAGLVAFLVAFFAGVRVAVVLESFFVVISSVYLRAITARAGIIESALICESADFLQSNSTIHVRQCPLDQLLKIVKAHRAGSP